MFENFCMKSGWSLNLLDLWLSLDLSLYECKAGLFDYILNGNQGNCQLKTYKFKNEVYELRYTARDLQGDFIANTCDLELADETGTTKDEEDKDASTDSDVPANSTDTRDSEVQ